MRIIIPMAGRGTRLRPHTLTVPKPLIPVAGRSIVERLVEELALSCNGEVDEVAYIIGDFGSTVEEELIATARRFGAKGTIYYQQEQLGTAHAIHCAAESLRDNVIVAFADTLYKADFQLDTAQDGVVFVKRVENPSAYGVVKLDERGIITDFVEKPQDFVSDLAIIGIYYFKDGEALRQEIQFLMDNDHRTKGEFQLTDALENMRRKGQRFVAGPIEEWLDFGNKEMTVASHRRVLYHLKDTPLISNEVIMDNAMIIPPCYIGQGTVIRNAVVGPYVSIGDKCWVEQSVISDSLIQNNTRIENTVLANSMVGNHVTLSAKPDEVSLGDYSNHKK